MLPYTLKVIFVIIAPMKQVSCHLMFLWLLCISTTLPCAGQEIKQITHPSWTTADTARIIYLVQNGSGMLYRDLDSALRLLEEAETLSRRTGFEDGIGYALAFKGVVFSYKGDYKKSFTAYREALPYCLSAQYIKTALPSLYINIGVSYRGNGKYELANYYYFKALQYLQQCCPGHRDIITIYNNLAVVQTGLKNHSRALEYVLHAITLSKAVNNKGLLSSSALNAGAIYAMTGQYDSAGIYYESALQIATEIGHTDKQQSILTNIGNLYFETGKIEEAISCYREAIRLGNNTHLLHSTIMPAYELGKALAQLKQYEEAEQILQKAIGQANLAGMTTNLEEAHKTLSRVYEATGRYREALKQYQAYKDINDSLTDVDRIRTISEVETRYLVEQKDKQIAESKLELSEQKRKLERNQLLTAAIVIFGLLCAGGGIILYRYRQKIEKRTRDMSYLKALIAGEEKERDRIARELHDGIGGMLTGMQLRIGALVEKRLATQQELKRLAETASDVGKEIHKTARNLTPQILQHYNLYQALMHYCEQFEANGSLHIDLQFMGDTDSLDKSLELSLYRVIQELIQNIAKHARARHAAIQIRSEGAMLYISVEDDGEGFSTTSAGKGLGLQHVHNRIQTMNGYCTIESTPGRGTAVYIEINRDKIPG